MPRHTPREREERERYRDGEGCSEICREEGDGGDTASKRERARE